MTPLENKPYAFDKRLCKSIAAAEVVLGPKALKRLVAGLLTDFEGTRPSTVSKDLANTLGAIFNMIDPKKQVVIKTDPELAGGLVMKDEPINKNIGDELEGYTLVDIKTAIAVAIRDDLTGFVLQALQAKWERELTLDDAENITFHLNQIIQLIK